MDPQVRAEAASHLTTLFQGLGHMGGGQATTGGALGGLTTQLTEFMEMPLELAQIFMNMAVQLTELVLTSLEQAGFALVKGLTPA